MNLFWCLPFVGLLATIALGPLLMPTLWHCHYGKLIVFWTGLFLIAFALYHPLPVMVHVVIEMLLTEYVPFILLLLALFIVSGGIRIEFPWAPTPGTNSLILIGGTLLASITGTTGAAILLIRPLISINSYRQYNIHTLIFFIFLVANIGGSLSPLGDPPLFLGFLNGIPFFWVTQHLMLPVVLTSTILIILYYCIDNYYYRRDRNLNAGLQYNSAHHFRCTGKRNIILLIAIILNVLLSGLWHSTTYRLFAVDLSVSAIVRDGFLIIIALISLWITPASIHHHNQFNYAPIIEVAKLFIGIFITIIPVLASLKLGEKGEFVALIQLLSNQGDPIPARYFWLTGLLSAFLDNAPTYLVFFNTASGNATQLITHYADTLRAISMGAVFMGSLTYIGNAPNFLVRNIALQQQIKMPSFFGYLKWSVTILVPIFLLITWVFF